MTDLWSGVWVLLLFWFCLRPTRFKWMDNLSFTMQLTLIILIDSERLGEGEERGWRGCRDGFRFCLGRRIECFPSAIKLIFELLIKPIQGSLRSTNRCSTFSDTLFAVGLFQGEWFLPLPHSFRHDSLGFKKLLLLREGEDSFGILSDWGSPRLSTAPFWVSTCSILLLQKCVWYFSSSSS